MPTTKPPGKKNRKDQRPATSANSLLPRFVSWFPSADISSGSRPATAGQGATVGRSQAEGSVAAEEKDQAVDIQSWIPVGGIRSRKGKKGQNSH